MIRAGGTWTPSLNVCLLQCWYCIGWQLDRPSIMLSCLKAMLALARTGFERASLELVTALMYPLRFPPKESEATLQSWLCRLAWRVGLVVSTLDADDVPQTDLGVWRTVLSRYALYHSPIDSKHVRARARVCVCKCGSVVRTMLMWVLCGIRFYPAWSRFHALHRPSPCLATPTSVNCRQLCPHTSE